MTGMALIASQHRREDLLRNVLVDPLIGVAVIAIAGAPFIVPLLLVLALLPVPLMAGVVLSILIISIGAAFVIESKPRHSEFWNRGVIGMGSLALLTTVALDATFGFSADGTADDIGFSLPIREFADFAALVLALTSLAVTWPLLSRHWIVVSGSLATSTALVVLSFMLWLHLGIADALTKFSAIALCGVVAILLARHVNRRTRIEGPLCPTCRKPTTALYTGCTICGAKLADG